MAFDFIYGDDDYLTQEESRRRWAELSTGLDPEFGAEIVYGGCLKVEEVEALAHRVREAVQTMGLFGGSGKAVWIKDVNFISDSVVARAEGTLEALEDIKPLLENAAETRILISASPVDRRLSFFKWLVSKGKSKQVASLEGLDAPGLIKLAQAKQIVFESDAAELFIRKVGSSARMVENELEKLAVYLGVGLDEAKGGMGASAPKNKSLPEGGEGVGVVPLKKVSSELVIELTSTVAEGEFFEPVEAFYSRKAAWALDAAKRYFTLQKDASARPLLASFFNRNRLLLLIKSAKEEELCTIGYKGLSWTAKADALKLKMGAEKTPFNLFAQNPWYLGKLAQEAERFSLKELESIQGDLLKVFEKIHSLNEEMVIEGLVARYAKA